MAKFGKLALGGPSPETPSPVRRVAARPTTILLCLAASVTGCYEQSLVPADQASDRLAVTNDEATLDSRVSYTDREVAIDSAAAAPTPTTARASGAPARAPRRVRLRLLAEVDPPLVKGEKVQATSVSGLPNEKAVVSYNFRGAERRGALDFFIRLDKRTPKLTSSIVFDDSDVNAVTVDGGYAYAAAATGDPTFSDPAVLERVDLNGNNFDLRDDVRTPLTSFGATSVAVVGTVVYATSGDGGHLSAFATSDLSPLGSYELDDARWVAWDEGGQRIVVLQGTPGRLSLFREGSFPNGSVELLTTFQVPGVDVPESKSTVSVAGGKAFVAAGREGVQVICLATGEVVGDVPIPDPASLGLDPSVVVTNAVTVDQEFLYISNGEAGVYIAAADGNLEDDSCTPPDLRIIGRLRLDDLQSVNDIAFRDAYLYVAGGLGGLKIIEVDH